MLEVIELLSCDPKRLYGDRPFADHQIALDRLVETAERHRGAIEVVAEVFPPVSVARPAPVALVGPDAGFCDGLGRYFAQVDAEYARIAPALLVRICEAIIWNNMLFAVVEGRPLPIYEFYRPTDRNPKGAWLLSRLANCFERAELDFDGETTLFVGSAGSFNYGHWLVDDLPGLACGPDLSRLGRPCNVLMTGFEAGSINTVRAEGTSYALNGAGTHSIHYLTLGTAYRIRNLHYVTPVSYHCFQKHPQALRFVRERFEQAAADRPRLERADKIFVNRPPGDVRALVNNDAVVATLSGLGFREYRPDVEPLLDQWARFAEATDIVGIMGAAMTSSLFSAPGSAVTHLAASGWIEPFYWDLAGMREQSYAAIFGPDEPSERGIYQRAFSVDPDLLAHVLAGASADDPS